MATKRPDSLEDFQRKQRERLSPQQKAGDNYPGLPALSHEEATYVEAAREALVTIKRTFEFWMVIARGLKALKDKAQRIGGKATFDRLREREGLGGRNKAGLEILNKTRVSRLLAILDRSAEVEAWRAELTDKERFTWASPEAVWRHATDADGKLLFRDAPSAPSPRPRIDHNRKIAEQEARIKELEEERDGRTVEITLEAAIKAVVKLSAKMPKEERMELAMRIANQLGLGTGEGWRRVQRARLPRKGKVVSNIGGLPVVDVDAQ
jgi:hypothetical protein